MSFHYENNHFGEDIMDNPAVIVAKHTLELKALSFKHQKHARALKDQSYFSVNKRDLAEKNFTDKPHINKKPLN